MKISSSYACALAQVNHYHSHPCLVYIGRTMNSQLKNLFSVSLPSILGKSV